MDSASVHPPDVCGALRIDASLRASLQTALTRSQRRELNRATPTLCCSRFAVRKEGAFSINATT